MPFLFAAAEALFRSTLPQASMSVALLVFAAPDRALLLEPLLLVVTVFLFSPRALRVRARVFLFSPCALRVRACVLVYLFCVVCCVDA